jgi:tetratricopeptide (TPR) repeat protein
VQLRRDAHAGIARALLSSGRREDLDAARENAAKASRLDPSDYVISLLRAEILLKTESPVDRERAIELLAAVASSDIDSKTASRAHNLSGTAYYKNGEYARALREFDYAVRLDPSNLDASENQRAASNAYEQSLKR